MTKRILVVEDEPMLREVLEIFFQRRKDLVDTAPDGLLAILNIRENPYDLILSDIHLPLMDGMQVLRAACQHQPKARVLMMSGDAGPSLIQRLIRNGARGYLQKPFSLDALEEAVDRILTPPELTLASKA